MQGEFLNVLEPQTLIDTVLIGPSVASMQFRDGWYTSFANFGAALEIPFFNVRNRNHGLPYNNQDTRDQTAYGMKVYNLGVCFFGPQVATQFLEAPNAPGGYAVEEIHSAVWEADLPEHASVILRVNQDDRLKAQCAMVPCGYGPVGGGMGHGDPTQDVSYLPSYIPSTMKGCTTGGIADLGNKWPFPEPLDVPRRATLSAVIKLSDYARALLAQMTGPHGLWAQDVRGQGVVLPSLFGVQISMTVKRYVQQRGEYHV